MLWTDEAFILSKNNFNENSIILEAFTLNHGKCVGIVYGGSSRKKKILFKLLIKYQLHIVLKMKMQKDILILN